MDAKGDVSAESDGGDPPGRAQLKDVSDRHHSDLEVALLPGAVVARMDVVVVGEDP
jgi:hypothetical protein